MTPSVPMLISQIAELRWHHDAKRADADILRIGRKPVIRARGDVELRLAERPVIAPVGGVGDCRVKAQQFRRSEEHTSELQSLMRISYAVFCLKKKNT